MDPKETKKVIDPKEIIKAMEIRIHNGNCGECAYSTYPMDACQYYMFRDAIELIKSLQAENEQLKGN